MFSHKLFVTAVSLIFGVFAYLQLNDGQQYGNYDSWSWVVIYCITGALGLMQTRITVPTGLLAGWAGFALGALFFRIQDDSGNFRLEWLDLSSMANSSGEMIQGQNEVGGLALVFFWSLWLTVSSAAK